MNNTQVSEAHCVTLQVGAVEVRCFRKWFLRSIYVCFLFAFFRDQTCTGAHACDCKSVRLWVRLSFGEMKYLIFVCLRSGIEAKGGVEFRHISRNESRNQRKVRSGMSYVV